MKKNNGGNVHANEHQWAAFGPLERERIAMTFDLRGREAALSGEIGEGAFESSKEKSWNRKRTSASVLRQQRIHPPLSQRAQRRAEGEGRRRRPALARGHLGGGGFFLGGRGGTGGGLDVQVLQDVVVDFGGDLLLLQHLPDGLVGGAGADGRALPGRRPPLQGTKAQAWILATLVVPNPWVAGQYRSAGHLVPAAHEEGTTHLAWFYL